MEKKGGASCDPGWNDPPLFSYDSRNVQIKGSKPRTLLNKRVAFPLQEASPPNSSNFAFVDPTAPLSAYTRSNLPPPPSVPVIPQKDGPIEATKTAELNVTFNPSVALETTMNNLCDVLNSKFVNEEKDKADIQRRLDTMRRMWVDDKLCINIQQKLLELSQALKKNETEKADDLQKGLMVDHAPVCSPWMSGVRHLIHQREIQLEDQPSKEVTGCL